MKLFQMAPTQFNQGSRICWFLYLHHINAHELEKDIQIAIDFTGTGIPIWIQCWNSKSYIEVMIQIKLPTNCQEGDKVT